MGILDRLTSLLLKKPSMTDVQSPSPKEPALRPGLAAVPSISEPIAPLHTPPGQSPQDASATVMPQVLAQSEATTSTSTTAQPPLRCPHCSADVSEPPKKKRKCVSCGQYMCVRKLPSGDVRLFTEEQAQSLCNRTLPTGERVLVTSQEAEVIDGQLLELRQQRMAEWWLKELRLPVSEYNGRCERLRADGKTVFWRDVIWSMCNDRLQTLISDRSYWNMKTLYYDMARFRNEEKKDCSHLLQEAARAELLHYKSEGVKRVEFISGDCKACKKLDGKRYRIEVALDTMPLPPAECKCVLKEEDEHYFCKSMWSGAPG